LLLIAHCEGCRSQRHVLLLVLLPCYWSCSAACRCESISENVDAGIEPRAPGLQRSVMPARPTWPSLLHLLLDEENAKLLSGPRRALVWDGCHMPCQVCSRCIVDLSRRIVKVVILNPSEPQFQFGWLWGSEALVWDGCRHVRTVLLRLVVMCCVRDRAGGDTCENTDSSPPVQGVQYSRRNPAVFSQARTPWQRTRLLVNSVRRSP
jgi:hypothetical protein